MSELGFVTTVFFMLLGPAKIIPVFGGVTRGTDVSFQRAVAIRAVIVATVLCAVVALAGGYMLGRYRISIDVLRVAGGLVLLVAALKSIFVKQPPQSPLEGEPDAMQVAVTPVAVPGIVPPTGIAAILIFMMLASEYPGMEMAVAIGLGVVMVLNLLIMFFMEHILKPSLMLVLVLLGSVFGLVQLCLGVQMIVTALENFGAIGT